MGVFTRTNNITYGVTPTDGGDTNVALDIWVPEAPMSPVPVVVYAFAGGFTIGNKQSTQITTMGDLLANAGYAFASIQYLLESTNPTADAGEVSDWQTVYSFASTANAETGVAAAYAMKTAVRFLKANASTYHIDTDKIIVAGRSSGGITAVNCAYSPTTEFASAHGSNNPGQSNVIHGCICLWGHKGIVVLNDWVGGGDPPCLLWVDVNDPSTYTPYAGITDLKADFDAASVAYTEKNPNTGVHGDWTAQVDGQYAWEAMRDWLDLTYGSPRAATPRHTKIALASWAA